MCCAQRHTLAGSVAATCSVAVPNSTLRAASEGALLLAARCVAVCCVAVCVAAALLVTTRAALRCDVAPPGCACLCRCLCGIEAQSGVLLTRGPCSSPRAALCWKACCIRVGCGCG